MKTYWISFFAISFLIAGSAVGSPQPIAFNGERYEQDFNALSAQTQSVFPGTSEHQFQVKIPFLPGWQAARTGGSDASDLTFRSSAGGNSVGRIYAYGPSGDDDRSLGMLATRTTSLAIGAAFVNETDQTINEVTIEYTVEVWRSSSRTQDVFHFFYGLSSQGISLSDFLTHQSMLQHFGLDMAGPATGFENIAIDGKADENRARITSTLTDLQWEPGETLFLSWRAINRRGRGAGLAMDDFVLSVQ
jgi:hypothetical protein